MGHVKHLLQRRSAIDPKSSAEADDIQPRSSVKAIALLSTLQSADIVLPTTNGREIRLRRITEPTAEQNPYFGNWASLCRSLFSLIANVV